MKSKMYLIEFVKGNGTEVVLVRNPKTGETQAFNSLDEFCTFLRIDVDKDEVQPVKS